MLPSCLVKPVLLITVEALQQPHRKQSAYIVCSVLPEQSRLLMLYALL